MQGYDFVLKFRLPDAAMDPAGLVDALGEAGCTDALVGIGRLGIVALDFSRRASSARDAVTSAIKEVQSAIQGVELVEATPDLVGLTELADILGVSRQYMRKLAYGCIRTFPAPIHEGKPSIWHLAHVLRWFQVNRGREVDGALSDLAYLTMHLNVAVSERDTNAEEMEKLRVLLA